MYYAVGDFTTHTNTVSVCYNKIRLTLIKHKFVFKKSTFDAKPVSLQMF